MGLKPGQKIFKIINDFESWQLDDPNPGRQEFFAEVMSALENNELGLATFNIGVPMDKGVGGYFTNHLNLDKLCLPEICKVDEANHTIKFVEQTFENEEEDEDIDPIMLKEMSMSPEESFAVFVHEACHFLHFSRDGGEFISPLMKGKKYTMNEMVQSPKLRRECEYEAGYRSVRYDLLYKMYPGSRQILETNLINMTNYDFKNQSPEWKEKYDELTKQYYDLDADECGNVILGPNGMPVTGKLKDREGLMKFNQSLRDRVQKFTEWADPYHVIAGVLD